MATDQTNTSGLSAARVEALSDGVFAIVMTLLILDVKIPQLGHLPDEDQLNAAILALWPQAVCYVMGFITSGALWIAHRGQFHYVHRTDRTLLWLNILFLMVVSSIPFFTGLLGQYPGRAVPTALYGINMVVAVLMLLVHWRYACRHRHLLSASVTEDVVRKQTRRILVGPVVYLLALALVPWSPWTSLVLYCVVAVAYILPSGVDRHWLSAHS